MKYLKRIDPIAYVRFASVYREFQDVRQLVDEAQDVMNTAEINPDQQDLFRGLIDCSVLNTTPTGR